MGRHHILTSIARAAMAMLVAAAGWTASPGSAAAAEGPDLTITLNPLGQPNRRSVPIGGAVSIHVWANNQDFNFYTGGATIRVTLPMGFTNVTTSGETGVSCTKDGPSPAIGGTLIRCSGIFAGGDFAAVVINATAPSTVATYEVFGMIRPHEGKDVDENNNYDSVWFTTYKSGIETKPNPTAEGKGKGRLEAKPNQNTRSQGGSGLQIRPNPNARK